ncbi:MAG: hypothetical protein ACKV2U_14010 [Bryobacteraceae bacterium]
MQDYPKSAAVPSLTGAKNALSQLATQDALEHLKAALRSLQGLAAILQNGHRLDPDEQRQLERALLRFRTELRDAGILAERGLAYCQDSTKQLDAAPGYQFNGAFVSEAVDRHDLSLEA